MTVNRCLPKQSLWQHRRDAEVAEAHVLPKQFADIFRDNDPRPSGDVGRARI